MMNSTTPVPPLMVTMEVTDEFMVTEIHPDGNETHKDPLTMSEDFTKTIQRIDFSKMSNLLQKDSEKEFEVPEVAQTVPSFVNPTQRTSSTQASANFDSIKSKIVNAMTNIMVLHDVMKVAKEQESLVMERVMKDTNKMDEKPITVLVAKKRALAQAASIISAACERLQSEQNVQTRGRMDFHSELLEMRSNWRLRKKGSNIIGDLGYRCTKTNLNQHSTFEVVRNDNPEASSSLKVIIPPSLEGDSCIVIRTLKGNLHSNSLFEPFKFPYLPKQSSQFGNQPWQTKLENAQNMLFNTELFKKLAQESVALKLPIPMIAAGNQILAPLFPGLLLSIYLCHSTNTKQTSGSNNGPTPLEGPSPNPVLEHSLNQLLYEIYDRNMHLPVPHPTSTTLVFNLNRYLAGPRALDRQTLTTMKNAQEDTILEQVIQQAQHSMLRFRTMLLIDSLAVEIQDPLIIPSWNYWNSPTQTSVHIQFYSYGYETLTGARTAVMLHIGTRTVKAIMRDGRVLNLSFESQELRHLLLNLISQHQVSTIQSLAKAMGWKVISYTINVGVGKQEPICGTASSIVILSPNGDRTLAVKSGPHSGIKVKLSSAPQEFYPTALVSGAQWEQLNGPFQTVQWQKIPGRTIISKMEFLMASLAANKTSPPNNTL